MHNRIAAACAALLLTGCSWLFMSRPPEPVAAPNYPIDCTSSNAAPILDTICTVYFAVNDVAILTLKSCSNASFGESCVTDATRTGALVISTGLGVMCGVAARSGFVAAGACQEKKSLNALCINGDGAACQKLTPGWVPRPAGAPLAPAAPGPPPAGCAKDTDCKGDRICVQGACVDPQERR